MGNVNRIRKDIDEFNRRKGELIIQRDNAADALAKARTDVLTGKMPVSSLESKQTSLFTLNSLVSDVQTLIEEKQFHLANSIVAERNDTLFRELCKLAKVSLIAGNHCRDARNEVPTVGLQYCVDKYIENVGVIYRCKERATVIVRELIPGAQSTLIQSNPEAEKQLEDFFIELEAKADCSVLRSNFQFVEYSFRLIDYQTNRYELPPMDYPEAFRKAIDERIAQKKAIELQKEIAESERREKVGIKKMASNAVASLLHSINIF
jgi:hypothetical protein